MQQKKIKLLIYFSLFLILNGCGNTCEKWLEKFKSEEIIGKIEKVELNHWVHDSHYIHIKYEDGSVQIRNFTGTKFDFLEYVKKGDHIYKEAGSLKVKVVRTYPKMKTKYFTIDCWQEGDPIPLRFQMN